MDTLIARSWRGVIGGIGANRSPVKVRLDGRAVSPFDAGRDFRAVVLTFAAADLGGMAIDQ
ncbi:MAG: hypothetical protein IT429_25775 [Gemmataceae bacterium]|nr:hypothetical protein [Gemmataceae bacterium]